MAENTWTVSTNNREGTRAYTERKRVPLLGLPWSDTTYLITEHEINVVRGKGHRVTDTVSLARIRGVRQEKSALEKRFGLGTLLLTLDGDGQGAGDGQTSLVLEHIEHSKTIMDFLLHESKEERARLALFPDLREEAEDDGEEGESSESAADDDDE